MLCNISRQGWAISEQTSMVSKRSDGTSELLWTTNECAKIFSFLFVRKKTKYTNECTRIYFRFHFQFEKEKKIFERETWDHRSGRIGRVGAARTAMGRGERVMSEQTRTVSKRSDGTSELLWTTNECAKIFSFLFVRKKTKYFNVTTTVQTTNECAKIFSFLFVRKKTKYFNVTTTLLGTVVTVP